MSFSHFFIDRPIFATVVSVLIVILGGLAYTQLPVAQYPEIAPPTIVVRASYPGADADTVARTVATSLLVKTAMHGKDPNWGRLLAAAGRAGVAFEIEKSQVWLGDVCIFRDGESLLSDETEAAASKVMAEPRYAIRLVLGSGDGHAYYDTCDLGHSYVTINADYRT